MGSSVVAFAVVLLPGIAAWWTGRRLIPLRDDPALPERLMARRTRLAQAAGVCWAGQLFLPGGALWMLAPGLLALLTGSFASRRALFDESWGLLPYLSWVLRLGVASGGFWTLLATAPSIVEWSGGSWPTIAALAAVLFAWSFWFAGIFRALIGARRLDRSDLQPAFEEILARSRAKAPGLYRAGPRGGRWVSALALPSVRGSAVLMSDTLLDLFDRDEIAAIFAHEVAHLEHYDGRRRLFMLLSQWLIVLLGVVAAPVVIHSIDLGLRNWIPGIWFFLIWLTLSMRVSRHQAHEAESDRRAVELCGDGSALARALTKLHALTRLPRRWPLEMERTASHPSLGRRSARPRRHRARRHHALPSAPRRGRRARAGRPRPCGRTPHPGPPRIRTSRLHRERAECVPPRGHGVLRPRRHPHASRRDRRLSPEFGRPCRAGSHGERASRPVVRRSDRAARMGCLGPGVRPERSTQRDRAGVARDRDPRSLRPLAGGGPSPRGAGDPPRRYRAHGRGPRRPRPARVARRDRQCPARTGDRPPPRRGPGHAERRPRALGLRGGAPPRPAPARAGGRDRAGHPRRHPSPRRLWRVRRSCRRRPAPRGQSIAHERSTRRGHRQPDPARQDRHRASRLPIGLAVRPAALGGPRGRGRRGRPGACPRADAGGRLLGQLATDRGRRPRIPRRGARARPGLDLEDRRAQDPGRDRVLELALACRPAAGRQPSSVRRRLRGHVDRGGSRQAVESRDRTLGPGRRGRLRDPPVAVAALPRRRAASGQRRLCSRQRRRGRVDDQRARRVGAGHGWPHRALARLPSRVPDAVGALAPRARGAATARSLARPPLLPDHARRPGDRALLVRAARGDPALAGHPLERRRGAGRLAPLLGAQSSDRPRWPPGLPEPGGRGPPGRSLLPRPHARDAGRRCPAGLHGHARRRQDHRAVAAAPGKHGHGLRAGPGHRLRAPIESFAAHQ